MYCPHCGAAVDEGSTFCPNCGAQITGSPAASGEQVEKYAPTTRKKPRIGYALSLLGGALTFLSGAGYFVIGNPVAGVLGVIFGILVLVVARRIYSEADTRKLGLLGMIPFVIGMIVLIASGTLLPFDLVVSLAGVFIVVGSSAMISGR